MNDFNYSRFCRIFASSCAAFLLVLPGANCSAHCLPTNNVRLPTVLEIRVPATGAQSLVHDGNASYSDGVQGVFADVLDEHHVKTCESYATKNCRRAMTVDLRSPVGAAPNLGLIRDSNTHFYARWYLDANHVLQSVQDIPIGQTVVSATTHLVFRINGVRHVLAFGDGMPIGACGTNGESLVPGSVTAAYIKRVSANEWTVVSPPGAWGTLINHQDPLNAFAVGEYYFNFSVYLKIKTKGR